MGVPRVTVAGAGRRHPGWPAVLGGLRVPAGAVGLRPIRLRDAAVWSRLRLRDVHHLQPWEPTAPGSWIDRHAVLSWPALCTSLRTMARRGQALPFAITLDGEFCGQFTVGNVVRGALLSAWVGYWVASDAIGGGVATAATALGVDHCLGPVGLHRVEATVRPENVASRRVLAKLGFREEGLHERYLEVGGIWRDHLVYALTAEDVPGGLVPRLIRAGRATPV
ncbi:MAG TPA: GNAT family protein [Pseudonocardiaceae bacterium]|jgi:ribosomal-protein-alanine N-acetyltransferase